MKTISLIFFALNAFELCAQWEPISEFQGKNVQFLSTENDRVWVVADGLNYRSDDQGVTWQRWKLPDSLEANGLWVSDSVAMAFSKPGSQSGLKKTIYASTDLGSTWTPIFQDSLDQYYINSCCASGPNFYFVEQDPFGNLIYRSTNSGASWELLVPEFDLFCVESLSIATAEKDILTCNVFLDDGLGDPNEYSFKSTDFGDTWDNLSNYVGFFDYLGSCWVGPKIGAGQTVVTFDNGNTFFFIPSLSGFYYYSFSPPNRLYAYNQTKLYLLNANFQGWESQILPNTSVDHFVETQSNNLFLGSSVGLWRQLNPANSVHQPVLRSLSKLDIRPNPSHTENILVEWHQENKLGTNIEVFNAHGQLIG